MAKKTKYRQFSLFDLDGPESQEISTSGKSVSSKRDTSQVTKSFDIPAEIRQLIAILLRPSARKTIYDPSCGSGELLIDMWLFSEKSFFSKNASGPFLFGEEANPALYSQALANMQEHSCINAKIAQGDALKKPGFLTENALQLFDYIVSGPQWNSKSYEKVLYESDKWNRFIYGIPPKSSADWGWLQHVLATLDKDGRAAIVCDRGVVTRGSNSEQENNVELKIRSQIVEQGKIETIILLPYNASRPCVLLILSHHAFIEHQNQILLIDASRQFTKDGPRYTLTEEAIQRIRGLQSDWKTQQYLSKVVTIDEIRQKMYNLDPGIFIRHEPIQEISKESQKSQSTTEDTNGYIVSLISRGTRGEELQDTKLGLLPRSWQIKSLADVAINISGGNPLRIVEGVEKVTVNWVQIQDLNNDVVHKTIKESTYRSIRPVGDRIRPEHTIMIAKSGSAGKMGILGTQATTNHAICCIEPDQSLVKPFYLFYYLLSTKGTWSQSTFGTRGGAQLTHKTIKEIQIPVPSLQEQEEIIQDIEHFKEQQK